VSQVDPTKSLGHNSLDAIALRFAPVAVDTANRSAGY